MLKRPDLNERADKTHRKVMDALGEIRARVYGLAVDEAKTPGRLPGGDLARQIFNVVDGLPDRIVQLERAILNLPVEDEVYICQECGNVVWQDAVGTWEHRNPQPEKAHALEHRGTYGLEGPSSAVAVRQPLSNAFRC